MRTASDSLREIIQENALLQTGLRHGIFNLSKLAQFLRPELEVRTKKALSDSAILMQLSRLNRSRQFAAGSEVEIKLNTITVYSNLIVITFDKGALSEKEFSRLHKRIAGDGGFFTLTEGAHQITFILEERHRAWLLDALSVAPLYEQSEVSALALSFSDRYLKVPGLIYRLCQPLYFQNVNVIEISSTATELILFVDTPSLQLAFDTLFTRFMPNSRRGRV